MMTSDSSFDTSAAETAQSFASGLSLGQCIKKTAEESQPTKWYELQPTYEKEWFTLQGEPAGLSTQISISDDILEEPITGEENPISRLLQSTTTPLDELKKTYNESIIPTYSSNPPGDNKASDTTVRSKEPRSAWSSNYISKLPGVAASSSGDDASTNAPMSIETITNILEKDDSLAQRVRELLEDEKLSDRSNEPELLQHPSTSTQVPQLLQSDSTQDSQVNGKSRESDALNVKSNPKSSVLEKKVDKDPYISTPNLVTSLPSSKMYSNPIKSEEKVNIPSLQVPEKKGNLSFDPMYSLNSTRSTEYGDLPDTVDIPQDIVDRINNLKMSLKDDVSATESQTKYAWPDKNTESSIAPNPPALARHTDNDPVPITHDRVAQLSGGLPISGDVQYHTGSNPVTPQYPVEEDKLIQLHSYITKKTGSSSISPLIVGSNQNQSPKYSSDSANLSTKDEDVAKSPSVHHPISVDVKEESPQGIIVSERKAPEGMSPPMSNTTAGTTTQTQANLVHRENISTPNVKSQAQANLIHGADINTPNLKSNMQAVKPSNFPQNRDAEKVLADESLLIRIKSALSDSMSLANDSDNPNISSERRLRSGNSSIDSLAVQVKALLEEEIPLALNNSGNDQSNLSEVIENFENTDLWRYVRQFLPTVGADEDQSASRRLESTGNGSLNDSALGDSFLEKVRFEYRKEKVLQEKQRLLNDPDANSEPIIKREDTKPTEISTDTQNQFKTRLKSNDIKPSEMTTRISYEYKTGFKPQENPAEPRQQLPPQFDQKRSRTPSLETDHRTNTMPEQSHSTPDPNTSYQRSPFLHYDSIPGIPDFRRSVMSPSSCSSSASTTPRVREQEKKMEKPVELPKAPSFTPLKPDTPTLGSNQPPKAETRNRTPTPLTQPVLVKEHRPMPDTAHEKIQYDNEHRAAEVRISSFQTDETDTSTGTTPRAPQHDEITYKPQRSPYIRSAYFDSSDNKVGDDSGVSNIPRIQITPLPSSKNTSLSPRRPSGKVSATRGTGSSPTRRSVRSPRKSGGKPPKSPYLDRIQVRDWLESPEHEKLTKSVKQLPTFDELMQRKEEKESNKRNIKPEEDLDLIPTSDKEMPLKSLDENYGRKSGYFGQNFLAEKPRTSSTRKIEDSSLVGDKLNPITEYSSIRPEVASNDSYQDANLTSGASIASTGQRRSSSDIGIQRRIINGGDSVKEQDTGKEHDLSKRSTQNRVPLTLQEFQQLGDDAQRKMVRQILSWFKHKKQGSRSVSRSQNRSAKENKSSSDRTTDDITTQAVCDSDSTEYCDLPSSRPTSAAPKDSTVERLFGIDESRAEVIMRRLMDKIERQKSKEDPQRTHHARSPASSSTPQRHHAAMIPPEASSIASTDTDAKTVRFVKLRTDKKHVGHKKKKVTYVEEVSSSEPSVIHVKRLHKKYDDKTPQRLVLHDRSIQTASPDPRGARTMMKSDAGTNIPSPSRKSKTPRKSRAVQTSSPEHGESLDDTVTMEPVDEDKENKDTLSHRENSKEKSRFSSFYIDLDAKPKKPTPDQNKATVKRPKSVAWYEPYQYQPAWADTPSRNTERERPGLVRMTLQEALLSQHPRFVTNMKQRQRKITINAEERAMQEIWAEERERLFGNNKEKTSGKRKSTTAPPVRRRVEMTRKQIVAETREKYKQLPEVVSRKKDEERRRKYATNRHKALVYKKKVQNQVLRRCFGN